MENLLADAPHKQYFETAQPFENEAAAKHFLGAIAAKHGGTYQSNSPYLLATNPFAPQKTASGWTVDYAVQQNQAEFWRGYASGLRAAYTALS